MDWKMELLDQTMMAREQALKEGHAEGHAKGLAEVRAEGHADALQKENFEQSFHWSAKSLQKGRAQKPLPIPWKRIRKRYKVLWMRLHHLFRNMI